MSIRSRYFQSRYFQSRCFHSCLLVLLAAGAKAAPAISSVVNAASNLGQALPNGGIAEGAIFVAYGVGLGPTDIAVLAAPFQNTTVGGTSIKITVNGRSVDVPMYYASAKQVAGLLPSTTPTGTGTMTVTFNGQISAASPITVVQSNFGTFAVSQAGTGEAILTYADYSLVSGSMAANPGETVILWGTGLGPVSGNETAGPLPGDMPNLPVKVWLGTVPANVVYRGRSGCCIGEDQIVFSVPAGITGCGVPLVVQINDQVSNFTTMAITANGRACVAEASTLPPGLLQQIAGKSTITIGNIGLERTVSVAANGATASSDSGTAVFTKYPIPATTYVAAYSQPIPYNTCIVNSGAGSGNPPPSSGSLPVYFDAGPALAVAGPNGARTLPKLTVPRLGPYYSGSLGNATPGNYLDAGHYTVTGSGGTDIGAFTASVDVLSPAFAVTNLSASLLTVDRAKGLMITWTGGSPNTPVTIVGTSSVIVTATYVAGNFTCYVQAGAGQFGIPPYVLLSLPASGTIGETVIPGTLAVLNSPTATFTAPGIDIGTIGSGAGLSVLPAYR